MEGKGVANTGHEDLIHDISYDFYGRRLATCSSDLHLKIWDLNETSGEWELNDSFKAHDASILRVNWAHPEHGQVIATCSADRSVRIFEEQEHETKGSGRRWAEKARLVDARGAVQDVWFAPVHLGFKVAAISTDTNIRIYEALEPHNLQHWTLMDEFAALPTRPPRELESSFCLTWCPSRWTASPYLAVGAQDTCKIYSTDNTTGKWKPVDDLELKGHKGLVRDVSWGPSLGRSYHLIATACKDGHVRVFKLTETKEDLYARAEDEKRWVVECIADLDDHGAEVWRVSWNATGTVLSSAGDDGRIRLWKASFTGEWKCMSVIKAEQDVSHEDYMEE
ncbi:WD40 repeat-like protein [Saitoella complicata NRRL Y-17804]|uniref:Uncharacterized protein n=1 Tax=Saitoella complicata (strain BCRC 22490 / CBS 7301 / JCM 7358 / NBRC 10748 / NRRL Y-17804) TaxID=698492 RepID=A0A0E9NBZ4_SAICN|nr:WD40 repeat-like protein [Saitoella complicata NRRL Y-17804]ODQ51622.1 WD40 repeat-like protein [Saitoella complicata NRRL Y-17804]GAO47372.1 hypothetical protein G7K_1580-t1 [Saitoella complicata NRRL Y-17804]